MSRLSERARLDWATRPRLPGPSLIPRSKQSTQHDRDPPSNCNRSATHARTRRHVLVVTPVDTATPTNSTAAATASPVYSQAGQVDCDIAHRIIPLGAFQRRPAHRDRHDTLLLLLFHGPVSKLGGTVRRTGIPRRQRATVCPEIDNLGEFIEPYALGAVSSAPLKIQCRSQTHPAETAATETRSTTPAS